MSVPPFMSKNWTSKATATLGKPGLVNNLFKSSNVLIKTGEVLTAKARQYSSCCGVGKVL